MTLPKPYFKTKNIIIYHGDCLDIMPELPDDFFDMILCDLPYGTTACHWDTIIPFEPLWESYKRIVKDRAAIVLHASQPFTSALVMSNPKMFKYCWVWNKRIGSNFASARKQPLKITEDIVIFGGSNYYPQMTKGKMRKKGGGQQFVGVYGKSNKVTKPYLSDEYHPTNLIDISNASRRGKVHPTQKPVVLLEYLIKTYTQKDQLILDNCMGSGSTAIACIRTNRKFIGIEKEEEYCEIAVKRIKEELEK